MGLGLKGKKALITGGSRGMGRSAALLLAKEGVEVAINYLSHSSAAEETLKGIKASGSSGITIKADISNPQEVEEIVSRVMDEFGRIDIWVHTAGIASKGDKTLREWEEVVRVHYFGVYYVGRKVSEIMKRQKDGKIIIISSIAAHSGGSDSYCTAMAAKGCYGIGLAKELAPFGINVNVISPGTIFTEMLDPFIPEDKRVEFCRENIPLYKDRKDYPGPDEIGKVILFLASDLASHVTGADIPVNGAQFVAY